MTQKKVMPKRALVFKTIKEWDRTYCCVKDNGEKIIHRPANDRNSHGHDPGYVYLAYLPKGEYKGLYKIGKVEYTGVGTDDFDLDEINVDLLKVLQKRFSNYHPSRSQTDAIYDGAQFIHGIRVACGEGAEKQPHSFFKLKKWAQLDRELYDLTEADIEAFKTATGSVLDRPIKHLTAEEFARYLATVRSLPAKAIREWVVLPDNRGKD